MAIVTTQEVEQSLSLPIGLASGLFRELYERTGIDRYDIGDRILAADPDMADPGKQWAAIADTAIDLRMPPGPERDAAAARLGQVLRDDSKALGDAAAPSDDASFGAKFDQGLRLGQEAVRRLLERTDQIPPTSPEYEWTVRVMTAVEQRLGLPTTWNGRLYREIDNTRGGRIAPDGRMSLSERAVFARIRKAHTQRPVDADTALKAVRAVHNVTHEAVHASGPHPEVLNDDIDPAERALHEALAEDWTFRNRANIVRDINLDRDVPETAEVAGKGFLAYGAYGNAGIALVERLATVAGRSRDDVSRDLIRAEPRQRWGVIVDLAMQPHQQDLQRLPADDLRRLRTQLAGQVRADFAAVVEIQAGRGPQQHDPMKAARRTGLRTIDHLAGAVRDATVQHPPMGEIDRLRSTALTGQEAPRPASKEPAAGVDEQAVGTKRRPQQAARQMESQR